MSDPREFDMSSDEALAAFLDDQLEPEQRQMLSRRLAEDEDLARQLAVLRADHDAMRSAFNKLLDDAPVERMAASFQRAVTKRDDDRRLSRRQLIAASFGLLAMGAAAGGGLGTMVLANRPSLRNGGWRGVVADYMSLYSTATLANLSHDPAMLDRQVASIGEDLAIPVKRSDIDLPGLQFRRAQMLQLDGRPLAQFAYVDAQYRPFALCVFADSSGSAPTQTEQRQGMNVVFWSSATHSYLIIGHLPGKTMQGLAARLRGAMPA